MEHVRAALSLPVAMSTAGVPIGVQLVAATAREALLPSMAAQIEAAAPPPRWSPGLR